MAIDHSTILGAPTWLKPAKFAISSAIYAFTLAVDLHLPPRRPRLTSRVGWISAVVAGARGRHHRPAGGARHHQPLQRRHRRSTRRCSASWGSPSWCCGCAAIVLTVALFRQPFADSAFGWALRLGMLVTVLGQATGGLMTAPTQRAARRRAVERPEGVRCAHRRRARRRPGPAAHRLEPRARRPAGPAFRRHACGAGACLRLRGCWRRSARWPGDDGWCSRRPPSTPRSSPILLVQALDGQPLVPMMVSR